MKRNWFGFLLVMWFSLSCGNSQRHLQSISIAKSVTGPQIQFVATGTFSAPPTAVTPLPVDWMLGIPAPPPKQSISGTTTKMVMATLPFSCH
jgi:hypothetical protein